jgi:flavin-dependent dehydrogenase
MQREFGDYPDWVEEKTIYLRGYALHIPGAKTRTLDIRTPATWRHTLDTWMCESAEKAGAEVWDSARLLDLSQEDGRIELRVKHKGDDCQLESHFVIGADGSHSTVRQLMFPDFNPPMRYGYRVCFETQLDLPSDRFNMFPTGLTDVFYVHQKGDDTYVEGVAADGKLEETIENAREYLVRNHGMDPDLKAAWRDGCPVQLASLALWRGEFSPAQGNILLVGDAAGVNAPISGEGFATALKTGIDAALSIIESHQTKQLAQSAYLERIDHIVSVFSEISRFGGCLKTALQTGNPDSFSEAMMASWDRSLNAFHGDID